MSKISPKGIIIGGIVDIAATMIITIPVMFVVAMNANILGVPAEQRTRIMMDALNNMPVLFAAQLILSALCSVLGGYVAARIAKRHEVLNGALSSFLCVGTSLYGLITHSESMGPPWSAVLFVLSPVLGALGGYLWGRRAHRSGEGGIVVPAPLPGES